MITQRFFWVLAATLTALSCSEAESTTAAPSAKAMVISAGLKFCEGSVAYGNSLLVSNFGTTVLNPLNTEGKGYIVKVDGAKSEVFIAADGHLSGPKGMAISGDRLFIADVGKDAGKDVGKVVVYNLKNKAEAPQSISLPEGNLYANDVVISGQMAYISVTNTGKIFKLDISKPEALSAAALSEYATVVGANGLLLDNKQMYIASYPADGVTTADNVIYIIRDLANPNPEKFITREGQYDGVAIHGDKLYFSSWVNGEIGYVDLMTKSVEIMPIEGAKLTGPADITILQNKLYIPNLPASEVVVVPL